MPSCCVNSLLLRRRRLRKVQKGVMQVQSCWFVNVSPFALPSPLPLLKLPIEEFTLIAASWVIRPRYREIRRIVLEFKARYIFLNSYIWCFLFKKSNLRVQRNNTLNLECKDVRDQYLENLNFSIHCNFDTVELQKMYGKIKVFYKLIPTSLHSRFSVLFFEPVGYSFQRGISE